MFVVVWNVVYNGYEVLFCGVIFNVCGVDFVV